jgi:hypothetical protein
VVGESVIKENVDESSAVDKDAVVRVLRKLAAFRGFGDIGAELLGRCGCGL